MGQGRAIFAAGGPISDFLKISRGSGVRNLCIEAQPSCGWWLVDVFQKVDEDVFLEINIL